METDASWTDRPVSIQVGGKTFACRLSTLRRFPDALLWKAYSFNTTHFDLVFWDRNPRVFEALLDYYRTNRLSLPRDLGLKTIQDELQFWGFDVDLPSRPPWPVLPRYKEHVSAGTNILWAWRCANPRGGVIMCCFVWFGRHLEIRRRSGTPRNGGTAVSVFTGRRGLLVWIRRFSI
jgi:hypothetical protein